MTNREQESGDRIQGKRQRHKQLVDCLIVASLYCLMVETAS